MKKKYRKIDYILELLFPFALLIGIFVLVLCLSFTSHASDSPEGVKLPYVCVNYNPQFNNFNVDAITSFLLNNGDVASFIGDDLWVMYFDEAQWGGSLRVNIGLNPTVNTPFSYDTYFFNFTTMEVTFEDCCTYYIDCDGDALQITGWGFPSGETVVNLFGSRTTENFSSNLISGTTTPRYPFSCGGTVYFDNKIVLTYQTTNPIIGTVTPFVPGADLGAWVGGEVLQDIPNKPSAPTWDSNLTGFENLQNMLDYLAELITWGYDNIANRLNGIINNLGSQLQSWLGDIFDAINNGFNNIYENIVSFFEPFISAITDFLDSIDEKISSIGESIVNAINGLVDNILGLIDSITDFFEWVTEPVDIDSIEDYLNASGLIAWVETAGDIKDALSDVFDVSAPNRLVFTVNFSNAPFPFNNCGTVTFNFDWYENIRNIVQPLIVACMWFGFVFVCYRSIPSIISGNSSTIANYGNSKSLPSVSTKGGKTK